MTDWQAGLPAVGHGAQVVRAVQPAELAQWTARTPAVAEVAWLEALLLSALTALWPVDGAVRTLRSMQVTRALRAGEIVTARVNVRAVHAPGHADCAARCVDAAGQLLAEAQGVVWAPRRAPAADWVGDEDRFAPMLRAAQAGAPLPTAVAHPCSAAALQAVFEAADAGLIAPILVGPRARLQAEAARLGLDVQRFPGVDVPHSHAAAQAAVDLVREGRAALLMKGSLHTDELLSAVLAADAGLRTERRLSHVFVMDVPSYHKLLFVTDAAINISPSLDDKRDICQNAIELAQALGVTQPKVAVLAAVETVNAKMSSTLDAAALCKMADRGQIVGGVIDGPLAMDNAISAQAAAMKGIGSVVAGDPDILLAPDLDAANILAKQLTFLAGAEAAGVVLGARVPVVLTSRADSVRARLASCAVASLLARHRAQVPPLKGVR